MNNIGPRIETCGTPLMFLCAANIYTNNYKMEVCSFNGVRYL